MSLTVHWKRFPRSQLTVVVFTSSLIFRLPYIPSSLTLNNLLPPFDHSIVLLSFWSQLSTNTYIYTRTHILPSLDSFNHKRYT